MTTSNSGTATGDRSLSPDVDDLVRGTMRDDLPAEVEARLDRSLDRFVAARAGTHPGFAVSPLAYLRDAAARIGASAPGRVLLPVASSLLFACGLALLAAGHRNAFAESFSRMNLSISLSETLRRVSVMSCTGMAGGALASPDDLADAVYRQWVLVGTEPEPGDGTRVVFHSRAEAARWELLVDGGTLLPHEIRRIERPGAAPDVATCAWEEPREGAAGIPRRIGP
jgi:hypothetical protein